MKGEQKKKYKNARGIFPGKFCQLIVSFDEKKTKKIVPKMLEYTFKPEKMEY